MPTDPPDHRPAESWSLSADTSLTRALNRLEFAAPLEQNFREDYEASSLSSRLILLALSVVAVALTPLYDAWFLHPPQGFIGVSRSLQFGLQIPGLLLAALSCWWMPLRRYAVPLTVFGALCVSGGLFTQRIIGADFGYAVPFNFAMITIAAVYSLARIRFIIWFPWALAIVVGACTAELITFGASSESFYNCLSLAIMFFMLSAGGYLLERTARENWYRRRQLSMLALHDPLTGLPNRRHFDHMLLQLIRAAARERGNVALMLIDIDEFKAYNDHYGHPAGDACLRRIGEWLGSQMRRPHDFCARIGGEEFVAVWSDAKPADARRLAAALRDGITRLGIAHEGLGAGQVVTASGGFVEISAPEPVQAASGIAKLLVRRADDLLYKAKGAGRNGLFAEVSLPDGSRGFGTLKVE